MKLLRLPPMDAEVHEALAYYKAIDKQLSQRFATEM